MLFEPCGIILIPQLNRLFPLQRTLSMHLPLLGWFLSNRVLLVFEATHSLGGGFAEANDPKGHLASPLRGKGHGRLLFIVGFFGQARAKQNQ